MSVRNALLGLLAQRPRHGYELHAAFEALVGGTQNWDLKPAQVYTTLSRLEEAGLVTAETTEVSGEPEKRVFGITALGREELLGWFATPVQIDRQRDEFFLKLMLSLATGEKDPLKILRIQRASLFQELHDLTARRSRANPQRELALMLLLDQAIMHIEADLRWMDMIEARLDEVKRQPLPEPESRPRGRPPKIQLPDRQKTPIEE
jgi:DNA-binding PadR family transcriptional regulator